MANLLSKSEAAKFLCYNFLASVFKIKHLYNYIDHEPKCNIMRIQQSSVWCSETLNVFAISDNWSVQLVLHLTGSHSAGDEPSPWRDEPCELPVALQFCTDRRRYSKHVSVAFHFHRLGSR